MNCFGKVAAMSLFGMLFFGADATAVKAPTLPQAYEMLFAKGQMVNEQQLPHIWIAFHLKAVIPKKQMILLIKLPDM